VGKKILFFLSIFFQVGSGEVFSIDEPMSAIQELVAEEEANEWEDIEVSEDWGLRPLDHESCTPQTPMTPLDDGEAIQMRSNRLTPEQRCQVIY
jgi:hypothetical protein